ncbi:MAG: NYN domain-containing protein [Oscillospiraceae bacterium]|nr:NYN domain-containing protein [Oscillospiraceae bacterium]
MSKTAILVDGGFYRRKYAKGAEHTPAEAADALVSYCYRHLHERHRDHDLYRIFYYDCGPCSKKIFHPLLNRTVDFSKTPHFEWMNQFLKELTKKRKVALRLGTIDEGSAMHVLNEKATKDIVMKKRGVDDLTESDFSVSIKQKGVDMKIGMDIASLAYKKQVDQIVLIAGDADFVPAAKLARREGIDFVLDPLGHGIKDDLFVHIDGKRSCGDPYANRRAENREETVSV